MDLTRVIYGPIVTEKAERLKAMLKTYVLRVDPAATKVDVKNALKQHFDVQVAHVRVMHVSAKTRDLGGQGGTMEKRHPYKKMLVTLTKDSKALDLAAFQTV